MQPPNKPIPPQPLLAFPPTPASRPLPPYAPPAPPPRPSPLRRVFLALPLVFVYGLLAFVTYAFLLNMCLNYLLLTLAAPRGFLEGVIFIWLCVGCGWSLLQCFLRGGGAVPRRLGDLEAAGYHDDDLPLATHPAFPAHPPPTQPTRPAEESSLLADAEGTDDDDDDAALEAELLAEQRRARLRAGKLEAREAAPGVDRRLPGGAASRIGGGGGGWGRGFDFGAALRDLDEMAPGAGGGAGAGGQAGREGSLQAKSDGSMRFCRKCRVPKPDRAHHCSSCGTCVLKMDHHCPWLGGGCVGWANYKFFLLFLLYSGALGNYVAVVSAFELAWFVGTAEENYELAPVSWAIAMLLGFVFGLAVGGFALYHVWLACRNKTTVESMERAPAVALDVAEGETAKLRDYYELNKVERRRMDKAASANHVYDLGWRRNLAEVFGGWDRRWEWLWPVGWPPGDGQTFPTDRAKLERLRAVTREIRLVRPREDGPRIRF